MRRVVPFLISFIFVALFVTILVVWGETATSLIQHGKDILNLLLTLLEIIGIFLAIALAGFILYQYIQYIRPHRFILEDFNNESALATKDTSENKPINFSKLAREEMIYQFKILYVQMQNYHKAYQQQKNNERDQVSSPLNGAFFGGRQIQSIIPLLPPFTDRAASTLTQSLEKLMRSLGDPNMLDFMKSIGAIVPKEVAPIISVIEAVLPPHISKATGYFQWQSPDKIGITFETIDVRDEASFMIRTIWENNSNPTPQTSDRYRQLLEPAMRWLVLIFWEQRIRTHMAHFQHPAIDHIIRRLFHHYAKERLDHEKAVLHYLLGALYFASHIEFQGRTQFFLQSAIDYFSQAANEDTNWYAPCLYLANIYSDFISANNEPLRQQALIEALQMYEQAINRASTEPKETLYRIKLQRATAKLTSKDNIYVEQSVKEVQELETALDPANFDPKRPDCAAYLFSLARWYLLLAKHQTSGQTIVPDAETKALRYLIYSVARSTSIWDIAKEAFKEDFPPDRLSIIKEELAKQPALAQKIGKDFTEAIENILGKIGYEPHAMKDDNKELAITIRATGVGGNSR